MAMTFVASDPASKATLEAFERLASDTEPGWHWHALVDLAFDEGNPRWPLASPPAAVYARGKWAALAQVSPVFFELAAVEPAQLQRQVRALHSYAAGRPMLSFVRSDLSATELALAMHRFIEVQTEDGQAFVLRWADTRVAVGLHQSLSKQHWSSLRAQFADWRVIDRYGELVKQPATAGAPALAEKAQQGPVKLSDAELGALLRAGEPDSLVAMLSEQFADLLLEDNRAAVYTQALRVCELAEDCQLGTPADRLYLLVACRSAGRHLEDDPRLLAWLRAKSWVATGDFAQAMGNFLESIE
ncbi:hypothetical protein CKO44_01300 [Rubrivivax gelatinosus]|uniref:DUF4123 domain-containing protein n=1 Tax=Rubrivivax gelatinosus TaxID=28068 RepID=A0ABS1DVG6_RUBGE|nr:DUF4123 domain-containing protein [Rubrivivax gelatinosus]MBK1612105.1 hypothetical protein [Rubrivivax gelatinosus]MBK1713180.1 hypothetical protein [Rubrivivax gelatinosus]MBZ8143187.1 hypothetical protein [Rubrivivax gelatinosus]